MPDHNHEAKAPPSHPVPGVPMARGGGGAFTLPPPLHCHPPRGPGGGEMGWVSGWVLPGCGVPSLHPPPSPALPEGQGRLCRIKRGKMVLYKGVNKAGLCKGAAPEAPTLSSRRPPAAGYSWGGTLVRTPSPLGAVVWGGGGRQVLGGSR